MLVLLDGPAILLFLPGTWFGNACLLLKLPQIVRVKLPQDNTKSVNIFIAEKVFTAWHSALDMLLVFSQTGNKKPLVFEAKQSTE